MWCSVTGAPKGKPLFPRKPLELTITAGGMIVTVLACGVGGRGVSVCPLQEKTRTTCYQS